MARRANKTPPNLPFKGEEMIAEKILFMLIEFLIVVIYCLLIGYWYIDRKSVRFRSLQFDFLRFWTT